MVRLKHKRAGVTSELAKDIPPAGTHGIHSVYIYIPILANSIGYSGFLLNLEMIILNVKEMFCFFHHMTIIYSRKLKFGITVNKKYQSKMFFF
jgi:hypothetical protein